MKHGDIHMNGNIKLNSQKFLIKNHILDGHSITSMEAFEEFKITRLAAVIHILRTKLKIPIETIRMSGAHNKRWAIYRIPPSLLKKQQQRFLYSQ